MKQHTLRWGILASLIGLLVGATAGGCDGGPTPFPGNEGSTAADLDVSGDAYATVGSDTVAGTEDTITPDPPGQDASPAADAEGPQEDAMEGSDATGGTDALDEDIARDADADDSSDGSDSDGGPVDGDAQPGDTDAIGGD